MNNTKFLKLFFAFTLSLYSLNAFCSIEAFLEAEKYISPTVESYKLFGGHRNGNGSQVTYQWTQVRGTALNLQGSQQRVLSISKNGGSLYSKDLIYYIEKV